MNNKVFISCAVTGSGDTASKHPDLPKTPEPVTAHDINTLLFILKIKNIL